MKDDLLSKDFTGFVPMPILRPVRIPTAEEKSPFKRFWMWLTTRRKFEVVTDYEIPMGEGKSILIPQDYIFDGASVPRFLWAWANPMGVLMIPALVHDFGYDFNFLKITSDRGVFYDVKVEDQSRKFYDLLFLKMIREITGLNFLAYAVYFAVRIGGWWSWSKYRKGDPK